MEAYGDEFLSPLKPTLVGKLVEIFRCDWADWDGATGVAAEYDEGLQQYRVVAAADHPAGDIKAGESLWLFPRELKARS